MPRVCASQEIDDIGLLMLVSEQQDSNTTEYIESSSEAHHGSPYMCVPHLETGDQLLQLVLLGILPLG